MVFDWLATRLREMRETAGLTQAEAAASVGVKQQVVSSLERGETRPPMLEHIAHLARVYETSVDYLLGLSDNPRPAKLGVEPSAQVAEMLRAMAALTPAAQEVAVDMLGVFAEHERHRVEESLAVEQALGALESMLSPTEYANLMLILEGALADGDTGAARARITALLAPERKAQGKGKERGMGAAGGLGQSL